MRKTITSQGITPAEELWIGRDTSEIEKQLEPLLNFLGSFLGMKLFTSDPDGRLEKAMSRMVRLYKSSNFDAFRPLIEFFLKNPAKSDQETYDFIKQEFNSPPSHRSFTPSSVRTGTTADRVHSSSNPSHQLSSSNLVRTDTTAGRVDSSSKLPDFLPALHRELNELMYMDVTDLTVDRFIRLHHPESASLLKEYRELTSLLQPCENLINQKYEEQLKDTSEVHVLNWITPILEHISTMLQPLVSALPNSRTWRSLCDKPIQGVDGKRKPDGAIMSQYIKDEYHIEDLLVPVELKKNQSDVQEAARCLAKYVHPVFAAQPTRSYVIGLTLCGTSMQLWQFDRSGAIGSESFDIKATKENFIKFLTLMTLFLTTNKQVLGFDPTFVEGAGPACTPRPQEKKISTESVPQQLTNISTESVSQQPIENSTESVPQQLINTNTGQQLVIDHLVFRAAAICGRGTSCWEAHLREDKDQKFLIKDSWQPEDRIVEGEMLCDVTRQNVPNVARYHHHEDVHVAGRRVDTEFYVRDRIEFRGKRKINIGNPPADPELLNCFTNLVHRRLILKDVGQSISKVEDVSGLLAALEGCIKGHYGLFQAGYLHRDISINNLMINKPTDPIPKAFLIDLDVAIPRSNEDPQELHARTGTKVFMSSGLLLKKHRHSFVDDLESFFWVLIWICIHYPAEERKKTGMVRGWNQAGMKALGNMKGNSLSDPTQLVEEFTTSHKQSDPLIKCVYEFAEIMSDPEVRNDTLNPPRTLYGNIINVLRVAQGKPTETIT
ncbi:hypothetical protein PTTG_04263 [Puccinia triticina 1-1 BBBD Race 1]|uniref:Pkinase_fungal domain-containing protein n=1 Tax=Puccinia triticina (isolate 1-1 / race 1 (BBBD)) TaxID=630390 RepID=A0A180G0G1_PUCT1|nr:hypothetical protein PTTG_04263 [Puccinia triticina 1-1 BBBD Race 1]